MLISTCLIVRLQVAMDSVRCLVESLRDNQADVDRIPQLDHESERTSVLIK